MLTHLDSLEAECPDEAKVVVDLLRKFKAVAEGTMSHDLDPNYNELIAAYASSFRTTQAALAEINVKMSITWKVHAIAVHLPVFLSRVGRGLAAYSEQCMESMHHFMKATYAQFGVSTDRPDYADRLKRAIVEFASQRI